MGVDTDQRTRDAGVSLTRSEQVVEGHRLFVYDSETGGDTIFVLLHGVGMSHRSHVPLATRLAARGRVITFDLPGFGGTPTPKQRLSVDDYARLIATALQRLDVDRCVVVGHSMGAQFALELALRHPALVERVVFVGPVTDPERHSAVRQGLALARDSLREPIRTNLLVLSDYLRCGPRWYSKEIAAMLDYPTHERVEALLQPLLVLRGGDDPIAKRAWCVRLARSAAEGIQVSIPGSHHVVIHTAPDRVSHAIVQFAAGLADRTRRSSIPRG